MKILQVNKLYYPWIGGVEKVVQQIAEGLNKKDDFEIEVLCCQPRGRGENEIINGVKVHRASSFGIFWGMPISFSFLSLFKKLSKEADIIDFHHPFPLGDLAIFLFTRPNFILENLSGFKPKAKLIVHYHSDIIRQKVLEIFFKPLIFNTLKGAEKILISNPNLIKSSSYLQKFKEKCEVAPFGVDLEKFKEADENEIQKIKEKYGNFILFVGRLNYYKGLGYLAEAMKDVEAKLIIIGEGPEKKNLEFRIKNLKLEDKIYFLPFQLRKELINFYKACSVFVLPSIFKSEAFGLVLIEAMSCGKPVISTELGTGTSFVNQNGVTGFVVPPKNSKALSQAIQKIIENKKLAEEFGQNGVKRVKELFSKEKNLEKITSIYEKMLF